MYENRLKYKAFPVLNFSDTIFRRHPPKPVDTFHRTGWCDSNLWLLGCQPTCKFVWLISAMSLFGSHVIRSGQSFGKSIQLSSKALQRPWPARLDTSNRIHYAGAICQRKLPLWPRRPLHAEILGAVPARTWTDVESARLTRWWSGSPCRSVSPPADASCKQVIAGSGGWAPYQSLRKEAGACGFKL